VLFALLAVGLIVAVGLAIDGGNALKERRIAQNAADASALGGTQYLATADNPTEQGLLELINSSVESNGVPDSDGIAGNQINDHVQAFYTDDAGNLLVPPNCNVVGGCGGFPPQQAYGVHVELAYGAETYFMGVVGISTLRVGADAVAVVRGFSPEGISDNVMVALGRECDREDWPLSGRANDSEFLGGIFANSWFLNQGEDNHYHAQVTYVDGFDRSWVPANELFEPQYPISTTTPIDDPFDEILGRPLAYTDFASGGDIGSTIPISDFHDVSILDQNNPPLTTGDEDGIVEMREIINQTLYPELYNPNNNNEITARDGVILGPNQLREGLYYAGSKAIDIGEAAGNQYGGTNGSVTIVSGNRIKITEKDMNLTAYLQQGSKVPGLLMFSDYTAPELANKCDWDPSVFPIINMAGNSGSLKPEVYHWDYDLPNPPPDNPDDYILCPLGQGCYIQSSNVFIGLIYAQNGRIATSGGRTTYIGSLVGWTLDVNGDDNLFVNNAALYPSSYPHIFLTE